MAFHSPLNYSAFERLSHFRKKRADFPQQPSAFLVTLPYCIINVVIQGLRLMMCAHHVYITIYPNIYIYLHMTTYLNTYTRSTHLLHMLNLFTCNYYIIYKCRNRVYLLSALSQCNLYVSSWQLSLRLLVITPSGLLIISLGST